MKFNDTNWKSLGAVEYNKRLSAFLTRVNSGIDRGDEDNSVAYVDKLFSEIETFPLDRTELARGEIEARRVEDGK